MAGSIYMIQMGADTGPVKIGFTRKTVESRLKQIQTGNPFRLVLCGAMPGGRDGEALFHKAFAKQRLEGEWFAYSDVLLASFRAVGSLQAGITTIPPATEAGIAMLLEIKRAHGIRSIYPDGSRHSEIDWDLAAELADQMASEFFGRRA